MVQMMKISEVQSAFTLAAFTLIEMLIVVFLLIILTAFLWPAMVPVKHKHTIQCYSNQRQIAISLIMFREDHAGEYPWQDSAANGGSFESLTSGRLFPHFRALSPYLGRQPDVLVCAVDKTRHAATNYSDLQNENISYFLNFDTATNASDVLAGDRHLEVNGRTIGSGLFHYTTNLNLSWSDGFHLIDRKPAGISSFADGHAQFIRTAELNVYLQKQTLSTNRFCLP